MSAKVQSSVSLSQLSMESSPQKVKVFYFTGQKHDARSGTFCNRYQHHADKSFDDCSDQSHSISSPQMTQVVFYRVFDYFNTFSDKLVPLYRHILNPSVQLPSTIQTCINFVIDMSLTKCEVEFHYRNVKGLDTLTSKTSKLALKPIFGYYKSFDL